MDTEDVERRETGKNAMLPALQVLRQTRPIEFGFGPLSIYVYSNTR